MSGDRKAGLTRAEAAAVHVREGLCQMLSDTPAGHLSLSAWRRIEQAFLTEIGRERQRNEPAARALLKEGEG